MRAATEAYRKSNDCWSEIESLAEKLAEPSLQQTSRARRLNLAVSMLDSKEFSVLAAGGDDPLRVPVLLTRAGRKMDEKELREIIRILSLARQRYPLQVGAEARDLPLIYEALAVLHRMMNPSLTPRPHRSFGLGPCASSAGLLLVVLSMMLLLLLLWCILWFCIITLWPCMRF